MCARCLTCTVAHKHSSHWCVHGGMHIAQTYAVHLSPPLRARARARARLVPFLLSEDRPLHLVRTAYTAVNNAGPRPRMARSQITTQPQIFQLTKCVACATPLDLPAIHFLCMHSFHHRCLGDSDQECPVCHEDNRKVPHAQTHTRANDDQRMLHTSALPPAGSRCCAPVRVAAVRTHFRGCRKCVWPLAMAPLDDEAC